MIKRLFLILASLAAIFPALVNAAAPPLSSTHWVESITMNDGLPHNYIDDIFRDSKGYMWISTSAGLSRFDGYEFINFSPVSTGVRIKDSFVRKVAEDKFGRLWVASDGGIDVIDIHTLLPMDFSQNDKIEDSLFNSPTASIDVDTDGNIWIRSKTDIIAIILENEGEIREIISIPHHGTAPFPNGMLKKDDASGVWTSIGGHISHLSLINGKIKQEDASNLLNFPADMYLGDVAFTPRNVWFATDRGVYRLNPATREVKEYHGDFPDTPLSRNFTTSLAVLNGNRLVVGTLHGLNIYDPKSDSFSKLLTCDINPLLHNVSNNFINCLYSDGKDLWIGTEGCGIDIITEKRIMSHLSRHSSSDPRSISPNPVNAILEDPDGTLWVGTVEGGLNRSFSFDSGFDHFTTETGALSHNSVSALATDHSGHLWVGTWGGGVNILDRNNPNHNIATFIFAFESNEIIAHIGTLAYDPHNDLMWVGSSGGLLVYDCRNNEMTIPFKQWKDVKGSVASVINSDGKLWVGGNNGLFIIDLKRKPDQQEFSYRNIDHKLDDPSVKSPEKITALSITGNGTIYVGTNGNGIYRLENSGGKESFVNITTADGLPSDIAHGIAEDINGNIWVATYHGLACMKPDGEIINFNCYNGLETEQFYWNSTTRLMNGDLLFGSIDGMLSVKGIAPGVDNKSHPVVFTSLATDHDTLYSLGNQPTDIPEDVKWFEIGVSPLDYSNRNQGRLYYRLNGFEKEWKELPSSRHRIIYTNISPGNYTLQVKYAAPGQSVEEASISELKLRVTPYFYKTWWFILLIAMAISAVVWAGYRWRVNDLTRQRNHLKKAVEDSVREISEQKNLIQHNAEELSNQNEELRTMARRVQALTVDRISFFTNITHEFRTPITLIIGPIERALKLSTNPKVIEQLQFVERNSRYLLSLVNQLMDFRKVESGKLEVMPNKGDFTKFIREIVPPFKAYAEERDIHFRTITHLDTPIFAFDADALRKIIHNLLSNAIKFTPDHGKVTMYMALFKSDKCSWEGHTLYISVSDTGCGIKEEDLDKVFDRYYQGKSRIKFPIIGSSDSGIGLYLCKSIVETYGGNISVHNNRGQGCTFRVMVNIPSESLENANTDDHISTHIDGSNPAVVQPEEPRITVLVVEDNLDMRRFMRSILSEKYNVLEAGNGKEALDVLGSNDVDFIISDIMMPEMDGIELARRVKEDFATSHIPVLMLTAKTNREARMEGYNAGVDEYLLKPFDDEILLTRIENIISNKRRYQQNFRKDLEPRRLNLGDDSPNSKFLNRVLEVLEANYHNYYFEVADLAEALGVNRSLLAKKVTSLTGEKPVQLLRTFRLNKARDMIVNSSSDRDFGVSELAYRVGFSDSKYFTRCFTKQFGMAPRDMMASTN